MRWLCKVVFAFMRFVGLFYLARQRRGEAGYCFSSCPSVCLSACLLALHAILKIT